MFVSIYDYLPKRLHYLCNMAEYSIKHNFELVNETIEMLSQLKENGNRFEWDIAQEKIDASLLSIDSKPKAREYISHLLNKVRSLPRIIKGKLVKYVFLALLGVMSSSELANFLPPELSYIKKDIEQAETPSETSVDISVPAPRKSSTDLVSFLKREEGSVKRKGEPVLKAYKLGDGMITVGWGHAQRIGKSTLQPGDTITTKQAEDFLSQDIAEAERYLNHILDKWGKDGIKVQITQGMYDAMVSMIFNMGIGNFRMSDFVQLVKQNKHSEAKKKIYSTAVTYPGHIKRRKKEAEMFVKNLPTNSDTALKEVRIFIRQTLLN